MTTSPGLRGWRLSKLLVYGRSLLRSHVAQHISFWLFSLCILTTGFSMSWPVTMADLIYTVLFHISLVMAVYVHLRLCVPYLLLCKKYALYFITLAGLLSSATLVNDWTFTTLSDWIFPGYYFISYYSYWEIALFIAVYLLITTLLKFSRSWADLQKTRLLLEETKRRSAETELRALRDQVNPHFLFNSLHSIYALALEGNTRTADLVLRLSDILRFFLYENTREKIPLSKELDCISAFIDLQRERLPEEARIQSTVDTGGGDPEIGPMMLMPLVENALKHGMLGKDTVISMALQIQDRVLHFEVRNRYTAGANTRLHAEGGIGLENLRRRLQLQYPRHHQLVVDPGVDVYLVRLTLDI